MDAKRTSGPRAAALCVAALAAAVPLLQPRPAAAGPNEDAIARMTVQEKRLLDRLPTMSPQALQAIAERTSEEAIRGRMEELLALDSLSIGQRATDAQGRAAVHRLILGRIAALRPSGMELMGSLRQRIAVPVAIAKSRAAAGATNAPAAALAAGGREWPLLPFWPNGALPALCPAAGIEGPLVYVGAAEWNELDGLHLKDAVALMDFRGGRNWERLFSLGCQAAVVVEDDFVNRDNAERLFCNTPIPFPRFFADRATGSNLVAVARGAAGAQPVRCRLTGGNVYENRPTESIFAYLPPTPPQVYTVRDSDLLERIAAENGVSVADLLKENRLAPQSVLKPGQRIDIPNQLRPYTVREGDLLSRVAADCGVQVADIVATNGIAGAELQPGQKVLLPNLDDPVLILVRVDSVCAVPDAKHGAKTAANLAAALAAMEHLASAEGIVRRKGIIFGFLDGDNYGGRASRGFAEAVLQETGGLKSTESHKAGSGMFRFFVIVASAAIFGAAAAICFRALRRRQEDRHPEAPPRLAGPIAAACAILAAGIAIGAAVPLPKRISADVSSEEAAIARYDAVDEWMRAGGKLALDPVPARWFVEEWIYTQFEKRRVSVAEARIRTVLALNRGPEAGERARLAALLHEQDERIEFLVKLRIRTLRNQTIPHAERAAAFLAALRDPASGRIVESAGLSEASLVDQFRAELAELRASQSEREGNQALVRAILARIVPLTEKGGTLGWLLDISAGSHSLTIAARDSRGVDLPGAGHAGTFGDRFRSVAAFAAAQAGWPETWTFAGGRVLRSDFAMLPIPRAPSYAEFWAAAKVALLPLATVNDRQEFLDSPRDRIERTNVRNISVQARTFLTLMALGLESPSDSLSPAQLAVPKFGRVVGRSLQFNIRSGIDARDPLPYSIVHYPALPQRESTQNSATKVGARTGSVIITLLNGSYATPVETLSFKSRSVLFGYHFEPAIGLFDKIMDNAQIGTQRQDPKFRLLSGQDAEKNLVLTAGYPFVFFAGVDPVDYRSDSPLIVQDAVLSGPPRHYGVSHPENDYGEQGLSSVVVFMEPERRVRLILQRGAFIKALVIGDLKPGNDLRGQGHLVGPRAGDRNLSLPLTPLVVAREMHAVAEKRLRLYRQYGIRDNAVEEAMRTSAAKLRDAERFSERRRWQAAAGAARESWGIVVKCYPRVLRLGREAVFSVVILMAALLPASVFLERLIIGAKGFSRHLIGVAAIFAMGTVFLKCFHPAFKIAISPFIILIAFTMILMSAIVLTICYQRFDILVRRARIRGGEAESEEISLASSLATAFSLGVSNLKKRPARTALTAFTVSVLTFSILTFVSVKGREDMFARRVEMDPDVEGAILKPQEIVAPQYSGVLFRNYSWIGLSDDFVSALRTEFGSRYDVAARAFYVEAEGGNNADREGVNQMEVAFGKKTSVVNGVGIFEPAETRFSGLNQAVSRQAWFRPAADGAPADRFKVILPDTVARDLGIGPDAIFDAEGRRRADDQLPVVSMINYRWKVIGILDTERADRMRDVNGKSLCIVDYLRSALASNTGEGRVENEPPSYHWSWRRVALVPMEARTDVGVACRSVAVRFQPGDDPKAFQREAALRLRNAMFASIDGRLSLLTAKTARSVGGVAKIIVPIILCILIVTNTMMGTVDERKGEVQMLGAIGLSPSQISFLLLSESTVFSILGIAIGTFSGLLFSKIAVLLPGTLSNLSFNFTSLASTLLAMGTGLVVLAATMVPARKASAMAAPSGMAKWVLPQPDPGGRIDFHLPFTLTRGNAVGMIAFFRRFMLNHAEATSADFNCRNVRVRAEDAADPALSLGALMWLAPYDLDVAQDLSFRITPTENEGVFAVTIRLRRTSGTEEAWLRTNYGFMDLVRHQFLLWRSFDNAARRRYIEEGSGLLKATGAGLGQGGGPAT